MSGARIEITLEGSELLDRLGRALAQLAQPAPLLDAIGAELADGVQRRFIAAKDPDGNPWEESERAKAGERGGKTLTDTGRLQQSISWSADADSVLVGSNVIYAAIHQFGGEIRPKSAQALAFTLPGGAFVRTQKVSLPARPFLGLDRTDRIAVAEVIEEFLEAGLAGGAS